MTELGFNLVRQILDIISYYGRWAKQGYFILKLKTTCQERPPDFRGYVIEMVPVQELSFYVNLYTLDNLSSNSVSFG